MEIKDLKAELFDIQVRIEQLVAIKQQKLQQLQAELEKQTAQPDLGKKE